MSDMKVLDQNPVQAPVSGSVVNPQGSFGKEKAPIGQSSTEIINPVGSEVKPNLSQEVSEAGVEAKSDQPNLTPEHTELGIDHAGPHVPVPLSLSDKVKLPMSDEEIKKFKTGQDGDSKTGLAILLHKLQKAFGL